MVAWSEPRREKRHTQELETMNCNACIVHRMTVLRATRTVTAAAALLSVVLLGLVVADGPRTAAGPVVELAGTSFTLGLRLDGVSATLLVLVLGVGAVSAAFAARHLVGGARLRRYAALQTVMVGGLALAVTAASLPVIALGWTLAGLALAGLVGHAGSVVADRAARQVRARLLAGDAVLVAGVVAAGAALPSLDRVDLAEAVASSDPLLLTVAASLVVAGAAARSALVPFHRWLPETAEAPTPVSALLHAGLVNGVGIVAVLAWPLLAASWPALAALALFGAVSAVAGTLLGKARPDTKGRLATSTTAQMGYLAVQVGLAIPAAALFHLVGHALYKATLFLGAGSSVAQSRRVPRPTPSARTLIAATTLTVAVTAVLTSVLLTAWPSANKGVAGLVPLALASGVAGLALARVLADPVASGRGRLLAASGVLGALAAFLVAVVAWSAAFAPAFAVPVALGESAVAALVAAVSVIAAAGLGVDVAVRRGRLRRLAVRAALQAAPVPGLWNRRLGEVVAGETRQPGGADIARTQSLVALAGDAVGPTWPLTGYVAANPVAGLERMSYAEALATASASWTDRSELSDEVFRRYHATGRIRDEHLDASIGDRPDGALVRRLLLSDPQDALGLVPAATEAVRALPTDTLPELPPTTWTGRTAVEALDEVLGRDLTATVDAHASLWAALVHGPRSTWMPRSSTIYATWRDAMATGAGDRVLGVRGAGRLAESLPERSDVAVAVLLDRLDVPHKQRLGYLSRTLARTPGWAAHQAWRAAEHGDDLADLLAVRLAVEVVVVEAVTTVALGSPGRWPDLVALADGEADWSPAGDPVLDGQRRRHAAQLLAQAASALGWDPQRLAAAPADEVRPLLRTAASLPPAARVETWQAALERGYVDGLLETLRPRAAGAAPGRPDTIRAQVVACIDVRSERLRRHLEQSDDIETLGFAGFFGVPFSLVDADGVSATQCPVLISPGNTVQATRAAGGSGAGAASRGAFQAAQQAPLLPLVLAEASGWAMGLSAAVRTSLPRVADRLGTGRQSPPDTLTVDGGPGVGFTIAERVYLAEAALRAMGLVERFAPVVVLLGHGGHVTNNPFAAGYDCGACGGNAGLVNARVAAAVLNDPEVRAALRDRGIDVPDDTVVVPGLHETTRDRVTLVPEVPLTSAQRALLESVEADLALAAEATGTERVSRLPGTRTRAVRRELDRRAADWAETRPEWGLAGNAALVVGPRELTRGLDLDGRTFLHSYRPEADPGRAALEVILTAPLVVAQWINSGYGFATLDPERFGAGDKVLHNPVGGIGVLRGAHGDLRLGLPLQGVSAGTDDPSGLPAHEPLRLSVVVCASRDDVGAIIDRQPSVRRLLSGRWIMLFVLEPGSSTAWQWTDDGWVEAHPTPAPTAADEDRAAVTREVAA